MLFYSLSLFNFSNFEWSTAQPLISRCIQSVDNVVPVNAVGLQETSRTELEQVFAAVQQEKRHSVVLRSEAVSLRSQIDSLREQLKQLLVSENDFKEELENAASTKEQLQKQVRNLEAQVLTQYVPTCMSTVYFGPSLLCFVLCWYLCVRACLPVWVLVLYLPVWVLVCRSIDVKQS